MNKSEQPTDAKTRLEEAKTALGVLQESVSEVVESNDLARLARMHTQCETLLKLEADQLAELGITRPDLIQALHDALQDLVLGEVDDADHLAEFIPDAVAELTANGSPNADELIKHLKAEDGDGETHGSGCSGKCKHQFQSLKEALDNPPTLDDLPALAGIHTLVEQLQQAVGPDNDPLTEVAKLLNQAVSGLILSEVTEPERLLPAVVNAVSRSLEYIADAETDLRSMILQLESLLDPESGAEAADDDLLDEEAPAVEKAAAPEPAAQAPQPAPAAAPAKQISVEPYESQPLTVDLDDRENLDGFIEEANEHFATIEDKLLDVEKDPTNNDTLNELFRPFHTIKGIAGFLNLRDINCLTHEAETLLDMGRKGTLRINNAHVDLILETIDILKVQIGMLAQYLHEPTGDTVPQPPCSEMIVRLRRVAAGEEASNVTGTPAETVAGSSSATPTNKSAAQQAAAKAEEKAANSMATIGDLSIRVDTAKLDALVDTVGELVIAQTMVNLHETVDTNEELRRTVTQVTKIVRDVQEASMAMRMVPVGNTFQKMKRVVRDVARKAGKNVELNLSGEETELDKNVIQQVSDPLVHMVRNAVDHGLEPPEERVAVGKTEQGNVYLDAYHEGDNVIIEISDDGRGLDPKKLIAKAVERGMLSPDAQLDDEEAFALILEPGFSTAKALTDISGRGVGMDVVRRNIEELRGKLEIRSEFGKGSTFRIRLPLTLAIIDGMLVRVGNERMVVPTIMIEQSLRPEPGQITTVQNRGEMLRVRDDFCPLIQVGQHFGYSGRLDPSDSLVVVSAIGNQKIGLVVDELIGQQQIVIKSLGERFKQVVGVSGAAILGDGQVGLILEPAGLLKLFNREALNDGPLTKKDTKPNKASDKSAAENAPAALEAGETPETPSADTAPDESEIATNLAVETTTEADVALENF